MKTLYINKEKTFQIFLAWYDIWIGAYYNQLVKTLYICPLPMICIRLEGRVMIARFLVVLLLLIEFYLVLNTGG